jgi:lysylphosphatidylglycerol synthetase-like protein (DUF2156 family)
MESDDEPETFTTLGRQAFVVLAKLSTEQGKTKHDERNANRANHRGKKQQQQRNARGLRDEIENKIEHQLAPSWF